MIPGILKQHWWFWNSHVILFYHGLYTVNRYSVQLNLIFTLIWYLITCQKANEACGQITWANKRKTFGDREAIFVFLKQPIKNYFSGWFEDYTITDLKYNLKMHNLCKNKHFYAILVQLCENSWEIISWGDGVNGKK